MKKQVKNVLIEMPYILIVILIVLQGYSLIRIYSLENQIQNKSNMLQSSINNLDNRIGSIPMNIEESMKQKASMILDTSFEIGAFNKETFEMPIVFNVTPNTQTEGMIVSLDFVDEVVVLEKSGTSYSGTKSFAISARIDPKIIIEQDGVKNIEQHHGLRVWNLKEKIFPNLYANNMVGISNTRGSNRYRIEGVVEIQNQDGMMGSGRLSGTKNSFEKITVVVDIDGEVVKEIPVNMQEYNNGISMKVDVKEDYDLEDGQVLTIKTVAVDEWGLTYDYRGESLTAGPEMNMDYYSPDEMHIIAPNGKVVYESNE